MHLRHVVGFERSLKMTIRDFLQPLCHVVDRHNMMTLNREIPGVTIRQRIPIAARQRTNATNRFVQHSERSFPRKRTTTTIRSVREIPTEALDSEGSRPATPRSALFKIALSIHEWAIFPASPLVFPQESPSHDCPDSNPLDACPPGEHPWWQLNSARRLRFVNSV
jgi:hypothetical protein